MITLGKLKEVKDLRSVWPHEAFDFTPWLAEEDNVALLSDAIGIDISIVETESSVGSFNVDIFATDKATGKRIIIENQLGDSDHDHLGKLITYASGKSASIIIWIVKNAREEHRSAIEWLNSHTDDSACFFLCEIKLYKIDDSNMAVKFEVIEKPNEWARDIKKDNSVTPAQQARYEYWVAFNDYAFKNKTFGNNFGKRKATIDNWIDFGIGSSEYKISVSQIRKRSAITIEFYIYENDELFKSLHGKKQEIEEELGFAMDWRPLPERKASRILIEKQVDFDIKEKWPSQFEWIMDTCLKIKKVFKKYI